MVPVAGMVVPGMVVVVVTRVSVMVVAGVGVVIVDFYRAMHVTRMVVGFGFGMLMCRMVVSLFLTMLVGRMVVGFFLTTLVGRMVMAGMIFVISHVSTPRCCFPLYNTVMPYPLYITPQAIAF